VIGTVLDERYRIDKLIGRGGFGSVYRGYDLSLQREVAIKVLTGVDPQDNFRKRFRLEMQSLARLNHPNIVTLYDCGEWENRPFTVMELVHGSQLQELVKEAPLSSREVCLIGMQVCQALAYAHGQGVIHRDLTLKNIMIQLDQEEKSHVKIVDFGLAKLLHAEMQTTGHVIMGTPFYLSPELIKGAKVDGRADIFAFGVGLYRILNGRFPFESEHPTSVMYQIVNKTDIDFIEGVPGELKDLVIHCLQKDPNDRPGDFMGIAARFKPLLQSFQGDASTQLVSAWLPGALESRTSKRNPYLNRVMITNPRDFFGREREIRKIYSRLDAPHPQSISIVGERRIGKSSLLNYIYHRTNRKQHMQSYHEGIFVYLDFQGRVDFDPPRFIDFLFNVFSYETQGGKEFVEGERSLARLKDVVEGLHDEGRRIIVLMDEFESITRNPNFDEGFFSFLRALANSYRVAYVTSSCDELQLMCHNKDISSTFSRTCPCVLLPTRRRWS
jgi:serine/threonine protein kinase